MNNTLFNDLLGALALPPVGRSRRVSSNEQPNWNDGNFDSTYLAPGDVLEMPTLTGPGVINHLWFTSHAGGMGELNALTLRIYWDGREEPGVEAPLGDFFACGQRPEIVESLPVQVSATGSLTCYWRMPFAISGRITVTNDNPERGYGLYWQADWVELETPLPEGVGYFHARYRQEYPAVMGRDYCFADLTGCGQYIGTVMSVTNAQDGWFGEGDDFFSIDGEEIPSLQGTGSEDYFNDAWAMRPRTSHWFGQPHWQGWNEGDGGVMYRWHLPDPVRFSKSLKVTMEHKGNAILSEDAWYIERPDFFSSVAFWYQSGTPAPWPERLPGYPERCVPWQINLLVRAFRHIAISGEARVAVQPTGMFGGRPTLMITDATPGSTVTIPFSVSAPGCYSLRLTGFPGAGSDRFEARINGQPTRNLVTFRPYGFAQGYNTPDVALGTQALSAGEHQLTLKVEGTETCAIGVESLRLLKLPDPAVRTVKTNNEAHFYRLGIGRAVYAYKLAYDALPESLHALHASGILPERYLDDENGYPFTSQCNSTEFRVTSTAPEGWTYAWRGLDARR